MADSYYVSVPQFNSVSFTVWERHLLLACRAKGYQDALTDADDPNSGKVMYIISSSLDSVHISLTAQDNSAMAMYNTLKRAYQQANSARVQDLAVEFHTIKQASDEGMAPFSARTSSVAADLIAAGKPLTASEISSAFLNGLDDVYYTDVTMILDRHQAALPDIRELLPQLLRSEARLMKRNTDAAPLSSSRAYFTPGSSNTSSTNNRLGSSSSSSGYPSSSSSVNNRPGTPKSCLYCHKPGHLIKDCRKRIAADSRKASYDQADYKDAVIF
jgi:hypothetical protein